MGEECAVAPAVWHHCPACSRQGTPVIISLLLLLLQKVCDNVLSFSISEPPARRCPVHAGCPAAASRTKPLRPTHSGACPRPAADPPRHHVGPIPPCRGLRGHGPCNTLVYAPVGVPWVEELMQQARASLPTFPPPAALPVAV